MSKIPNIHPGEILLREFLEPMNISQNKVARDIGVPPRRINEIVLGKRAVTPDTGLRLDRYFGLSEGYWYGLQFDYDMAESRDSLRKTLKHIVPFTPSRNNIADKSPETR